MKKCLVPSVCLLFLGFTVLPGSADEPERTEGPKKAMTSFVKALTEKDQELAAASLDLDQLSNQVFAASLPDLFASSAKIEVLQKKLTEKFGDPAKGFTKPILTNTKLADELKDETLTFHMAEDGQKCEVMKPGVNAKPLILIHSEKGWVLDMTSMIPEDRMNYMVNLFKQFNESTIDLLLRSAKGADTYQAFQIDAVGILSRAYRAVNAETETGSEGL